MNIYLYLYLLHDYLIYATPLYNFSDEKPENIYFMIILACYKSSLLYEVLIFFGRYKLEIYTWQAGRDGIIEGGYFLPLSFLFLFEFYLFLYFLHDDTR
jgi:hypothetical protein